MTNLGVDAEVGLGVYGGGDIPIEGFGKNVTGHTGSTVYTVTSAENTGEGTLTDILQTYHDDCRIEFAEGLDTVNIYGADCWVRKNVTIDGYANGHGNGVTVVQPFTNAKAAIAILGKTDGTWAGNVLIRGINFRGNANDTQEGGYTGDDLIRIDAGGLCDVSHTVGQIDGVLIHHCTFYRASDGAIDITTDSGYQNSVTKNVTIQQCMFTQCGGCMLIKYGHAHDISIHHNVYVHNGERNPQIRGSSGVTDYVNNLIFQNATDAGYPSDYIEHWWDGSTTPHGIYIWCSTGGGSVGNPAVNVRGCAFLGDKSGTAIEVDSGASDADVYFDLQGTTASSNFWDATPDLEASPRETPNTIASGFEITRHAITDLVGLLPQIGCPTRVGTDQTRLDDIASYWPL